MKKRFFLFIILLFAVSFITLKTISILFLRDTIKVGIIHSLTGDLAISEKSVADATLLAINEINSKGGILGKYIEPLLVDGKSDDIAFGIEAERLITQKKVVALFGG